MFITHSECCEDAGSDALGLGMDLRAFVSHKSPGDDMLISHSCFNRKVLITCSEKAMAPHSSTLAWKIPLDRGAWWVAVHGISKSWTRLSNFTFTFHFHALEKEVATHSSVLAWRIPGWGSLVGCRLWGHTELDRTDVT